MATFEEIKKKT